jgi:hypothetical protein
MSDAGQGPEPALGREPGAAAQTDANLMPHILDCVQASAT